MADYKAISNEFDECPVCGDYMKVAPGGDYVEVTNYNPTDYRAMQFCSMECLKERFGENDD